MSERISYGAASAFVPSTIAGGNSSDAEIFGAAIEQMRLVDNTNAAHAALEQAYAERSAAIKAATGEDLGNPMTSGPSGDALNAILISGIPGQAIGQRQHRVDAMTAYQKRLEELAAAASPEIRQIIAADRPIEKDAEALARKSDDELARLMAANPGWTGTVSSIAGALAGSLRDPVTIGSLFVGGGSGAAKTALGRILQTAAREAFVNGGVVAAMQPSSQGWREQAGLPHGFDEAASNVLFAAALGGGLGFLAKGAHEAAVPLLRRVAPALAPEARGALQALEMADTLDAQKPAGVPQESFDRQVMKADVAAQGREVPLSPDVPDEVAVNRIVNALAPRPESVTGPIEPRTDASIDALVTLAKDPGKAALGAPTPILDHIRALGGVDPSSPAAAELKAAGVTAKSIFRKGGLKALDNLPYDELPDGVRHAIADDGNGYASEDALVQAAGGEASGYGAGQTVDDVAAIRDHYERQGVDFSAPIEEVRAQVRAVDDAAARYDAASGSDGLSTDEVVSVPEGLSRRQHTEQLVRAALREQPGLPADLVQRAVNLSLFENVPIEEAVSDVMSDVAGVPRIAEEQAAIAAAYDQVRGAPSGPVSDPLVQIRPDDIEGTILERGAFRDVNDVEVSKRGFGLVKIIWQHGEESGKPAALRVRKSDVLALPEIVRRFEPSSSSGRGREWRVERGGKTLVYADSTFADGNRHVVTIYVQDPERAGADAPLSAPRASRPVPPGVRTTAEATAGGLSTARPGAAERPGELIDRNALGSEPPPLEPDRVLEDEPFDMAAELEAMKELGFGAGDDLPIGDGMMSLEALQKQLDEGEWLEHVVEACKA